MTKRGEELKNTTYEIFIGVLSILSIVNIALYYLIPSPDVSAVVVIMDSFLTLIFLSDFIYRLSTADSKRDYVFKQFGWADFLASLPMPQLKILRLFRVFRAGRMMREFGAVGIVKEYLSNRAHSALLTLLLLVLLLLEFGSMAVLSVEQYAPDANITSGGDAIWYTFVTITTVGYGDQYPVTSTGRLFGMLVMAIGVGVFGTLTGYLSNFFLSGSGEGDNKETASQTEPGNGAETAPGVDDPKAKLNQLKRLLAEQQATQVVLAQKIEELEALL